MTNSKTIPDMLDDRDVVYRQYYNGKQREYLKAVINDELIAEHKAKPLGQHSEPLARLLNYLHRLPNKGKYIVVKSTGSDVYRIATLSGNRGVGPKIEDDLSFLTINAAYHGIFLKQINEIMGA